jgi:SAM-dependent methyltransferase
VVLEVGPGMGSQLDRFDKSKIDHIYGVELNPALVSPLLAEVQASKLHGRYTVILGAVEDDRLLAEHGLKAGSVDSIVCVGTLCSVSDPEQVMRSMYALLKPGGAFIFWEHRRSHDFLTQLVQGMLALHICVRCLLTIPLEFWNPLWQFIMGGCNLNRSAGDIILNAGDWDLHVSDLKAQNDPKSEWALMPRAEGILIKRA